MSWKDARLDGKVVIVTGANSGIGKATATELARRGARVFLTGRDMTSLSAARDEIVAVTGNVGVEVRYLDLASQQSIRQFVHNFNNSESRLDILVNNAGVFTRERQETEDGFELHFGVNHLGHFLLTFLLVNKLVTSAPSRIVTVSSKGHEFTKLDLNDLQTRRHWTSLKAYSRSKTANVLFSSHLARILQGTGVSTYCVHPGIVKTELGRHFENTLAMTYFNVMWSCFCGQLMTPDEGAQTSLYCCTEPTIANTSGQYYSKCGEKAAKKHAIDPMIGEKLWHLSSQLFGLPTNPVTFNTATTTDHGI